MVIFDEIRAVCYLADKCTHSRTTYPQIAAHRNIQTRNT